MRNRNRFTERNGAVWVNPIMPWRTQDEIPDCGKMGRHSAASSQVVAAKAFSFMAFAEWWNNLLLVNLFRSILSRKKKSKKSKKSKNTKKSKKSKMKKKKKEGWYLEEKVEDCGKISRKRTEARGNEAFFLCLFADLVCFALVWNKWGAERGAK